MIDAAVGVLARTALVGFDCRRLERLWLHCGDKLLARLRGGSKWLGIALISYSILPSQFNNALVRQASFQGVEIGRALIVDLAVTLAVAEDQVLARPRYPYVEEARLAAFVRGLPAALGRQHTGGCLHWTRARLHREAPLHQSGHVDDWKLQPLAGVCGHDANDVRRTLRALFVGALAIAILPQQYQQAEIVEEALCALFQPYSLLILAACFGG